jgi:hypothetical protein
MALETASFLNGLVSANPPSGDPATQADDHLRLIKSVLLATFPNLNAAVNLTPAQMNFPVPIGVICDWYGSSGSVPAGWGLCNGTVYTRTDGGGNITSPDLRDKYRVGASGTVAYGTLVGAAPGVLTSTSGGAFTPAGTLNAAGGHSHGGVTGSHVLDITQIPAHSHTFGTSAAASTAPGGNTVVVGSNWSTSSVGGGLGHTHTITAEANHTHTFTGTAVAAHTHAITTTLPPSMALWVIMKI